jgi:beta-glucuronidase
MLFPLNTRFREQISLDGFWRFAADPDKTGASKNWGNGFVPEGFLAVPASWNEQRNELYHYHGRLWYQRTFTIPKPAEGKCVVLHFAGALYKASVYLNGKHLGECDFGLLPFEFDITHSLRADGTNLLVVAVEGYPDENQAIGKGDFYEYGGIHRSVSLLILNQAHIERLEVDPRSIEGNGSLSIAVEATAGSAVEVEIAGIRKRIPLSGNSGRAVVDLPAVTLWSCEQPHLYNLTVTLFHGEDAVDEYSLRVGFREIRVEGRQILLNGKPIKLRGFGKHEDFHIIGRGTNHSLILRDFSLIKWTGANSFRTSHYPYSEEMLLMADELGFLVIDEAPFVNLSEKDFVNPEKAGHAQRILRNLIARDRNHPSVISWSMGNECATSHPDSAAFFGGLIDTVRTLDDRPIMYVAWTRPGEDHVYPLADIIGINRYYGWYTYNEWDQPVRPGDLPAAIKELGSCVDQFAELYHKPIILSEFGADTIAGFHSMFLQQFTEEFQVRFLVDYINVLETKKAVAGMHIWNFADFNTGMSPLRVNGNRKGLFTRERTPKSAAFAVRKLWTGKDDCGLFALGDNSAETNSTAIWEFQ